MDGLYCYGGINITLCYQAAVHIVLRRGHFSYHTLPGGPQLNIPLKLVNLWNSIVSPGEHCAFVPRLPLERGGQRAKLGAGAGYVLIMVVMPVPVRVHAP